MEAVAIRKEQFTDKLNRLVKGRVKADLAAEAGVSPQALQRYLDGSAPRPSVAVKLARALGVDPLWLIDEDRTEWPPPSATPSLLHADDQSLMSEVNRRMSRAIADFKSLVELAEEVDWSEIGRRLAQHNYAAPLPPDLEQLVVFASTFHLQPKTSVDVYTPKAFRHTADGPPAVPELIARWRSVIETNRAFAAVHKFALPTLHPSLMSGGAVKHLVKSLKENLERLETEADE